MRDVQCQAPGHGDEELSMTLRAVRTELHLSQAEFAARLNVSVNSLRVWDSGRRPPPAEVLGRAEALLQDPDERLLPLRLLAERFHVHVRTLRAAARDGRLRATFTNRAFFGQPGRDGDRESGRNIFGYGVRQASDSASNGTDACAGPA